MTMPEMKRMTLWDKYFRLLWDSDLRSAMRDPKLGPAYEAVDEWVHATIDFVDGTKWTGQLFRCPEGIKRFSCDDLKYVTWPVSPLVADHA